MQLENRNRFQACQEQIEIRNLKQGYLILNEYQFWKIQVNRIMISIKEPNKRQIGKLENRNRFHYIYRYYNTCVIYYIYKYAYHRTTLFAAYVFFIFTRGFRDARFVVNSWFAVIMSSYIVECRVCAVFFRLLFSAPPQKSYKFSISLMIFKFLINSSNYNDIHILYYSYTITV